MWVMISAPALVPVLAPIAGAAAAGIGVSRGLLLLGCGVEVRAGAAGRADEALRAADSDISDLNFAREAARDMAAVCGRWADEKVYELFGKQVPRRFNKELWVRRSREKVGGCSGHKGPMSC